ncbi:MAG: IPExxxVDY family protein [Bacteroidetes bacterium]|nr:IPExxxVDY family protein [Bacteroidota bacterium]
MKKKRLDVEFTLDFDLYGITAVLKPYKLAWEINRCLHIQLVKTDDYEVVQKNQSVNHYFHYTQSTTHSLVKLFRNKPAEENEERNLLLPEMPRFDFILLTRGDSYSDSNRLQELLRNIPSVEWAAFIPLAALKSKEHLIF